MAHNILAAASLFVILAIVFAAPPILKQDQDTTHEAIQWGSPAIDSIQLSNGQASSNAEGSAGEGTLSVVSGSSGLGSSQEEASGTSSQGCSDCGVLTNSTGSGSASGVGVGSAIAAVEGQGSNLQGSGQTSSSGTSNGGVADMNNGGFFVNNTASNP